MGRGDSSGAFEGIRFIEGATVMRRFGFCLAGLIAGYIIGAGLGAAAIQLFSANTHDKSVELAMTSAFVAGPIGALIGAVVGWMRGRKS